jgi:opacity protein-like surface antigen
MAVAGLLAVAAMAAMAADAVKVITPFNGKDLAGWKLRDAPKTQWKVGTASLDPKNPKQLVVAPEGSELVNLKAGCDLLTEAEFGDCTVQLEFMIPKGSNSGVYLMGRYEVQVLDSFGKEKDFEPGDMGGIYSTAAPVKPTYKAPGEWQTLEIVFQAPRFDPPDRQAGAAGKKTANARFVKVVLNGATIHENVEAPKPTGGELGPEVAKGPLMFQGDHGPVAFRNIKIMPAP